MKPWVTLAHAETPEHTPLLLQQRGEEFAIRVGTQLLMSSRTHGSEEALARAALEKARPAPREILVGGLGMGYTLRAVLDRAPASAQVRVAELVPAVVAWNRGPLAPLARAPLEDARVQIFEGDVRTLLEPGRFDTVLLDVDNGPAALTQEANASLYSGRGLSRLHESLRARGRLAIWSATPEPSFLGKLKRVGFKAQMLPAGGRHVIYLGERA